MKCNLELNSFQKNVNACKKGEPLCHRHYDSKNKKITFFGNATHFQISFVPGWAPTVRTIFNFVCNPKRDKQTANEWIVSLTLAEMVRNAVPQCNPIISILNDEMEKIV